MVTSLGKTFDRILTGEADANIGFYEIRALLRALGFAERIRGGHHIFAKAGIAEIMNLQAKATRAKPYQVRQVRKVILKYGMRLP